MTAFDMFRDLLLQVFTKEVCIGVILFTLLLLFMSLITNGDSDRKKSLKPEGDDDKTPSAHTKDGNEYPM